MQNEIERRIIKIPIELRYITWETVYRFFMISLSPVTNFWEIFVIGAGMNVRLRDTAVVFPGPKERN